MRFARLGFLCGASVLAFVSCTSAESGTTPSPEQVTDASDERFPSLVDGGISDPLASDAALSARVRTVFASSCAGLTGENFCHASGAAGLHLTLAPDGGDVVGVRSTERPELFRVAPGDPESSYLYLKVLGDGGIDGSRMPADRATFDPRLPELLHAWIEAGAPLPSN